MSLLLDLKYISLLSSQLRNFKRKNDCAFQFACPICGDSAKDRGKSRGYVFRQKNLGDGLAFHCFNHGGSLSFKNFLKEVDPSLHQEYTTEDFIEKRGGRPSQPVVPMSRAPEPRTQSVGLRGLPTISMLAEDHPARVYLTKRKIPKEFLTKLYFAEDFAVLAAQFDPNMKLKSEPRIIIPCYSEDLKLWAVQGRSLPGDNRSLRYITIKTHPDNPKTFGMDRLNREKRIYVVEGPLDSLFIPNCIAAAGSDIPNTLPVAKCWVAYDNERRNHEIVENMLKAVSRGYHICVWPDNIKEKDINDMVIAGYTKNKIREIIDCNSYQSMEARLHISRWRRDQ